MGTPRVYRTPAIVLRRHNFGEADRVLTLYSPLHGKFRAVAKGARRPKSRLGGHVELFTHVNLLVAQGRSLDIVTQAETMRPFGHLREDLWKAAYACYAVEMVDRFTPERLEQSAIFDLLLEVLTYLDQLGTSAAPGEVRDGSDLAGEVELAMRSFELHLLGQLGYSAELYQCVQCGRRLVPEENRFSAALGGVLCATCGSMQPSARLISVNAIKAMRLLGAEPLAVVPRLRLPIDAALEVEGALRAHVNALQMDQLRTSEFLDRLKSDRQREFRAAIAPERDKGELGVTLAG